MKTTTRYLPLLLVLLLALALTGCGGKDSVPAAAPATAAPESGGRTITLLGDHVECSGEGVSVSGSVATVTKGGEYLVSGTLDNGRILVDTGEAAEKVTLILANAHLSNAEGAAILVQQADKVKLVLADGSENSVTSGSEGMPLSEDANGAAIFSEDDLDIEGEGALSVFGYINNGITCKDDLTIQGGVLTVCAANNGLRGSESVRMEAGSLTVEAGNDGLKSTSAKKQGKGYISVSGGEVTVTAAGDGLSAATQLLVTGGVIRATTTGDPQLGSAKALKAEQGILLEGGVFTLDSTDHAIRSSGDLEIRGGVFTVSSSMGRGLAARGEVRISGEPELDINAIEDGILSDTDVRIEGGSFRIASGEDGIHAGDSMTGEGSVTIEGGSLLISAYHDGIDAKSHLYVHGGNVLAVGRSKTEKPFSAGSAQPFLSCSISAPSHSEVVVSAADGSVLGRMVVSYGFSQLLFSSASLERGAAYTVSADGVTVNAVA